MAIHTYGAPVNIRRDPFARMTLEREKLISWARQDCPSCGQTARFAYAWVGDQNHDRPRAFWRVACSVSCFESLSA